MATFAEAAAALEAVARRARDAAEPCAVAMAEAAGDHISRITLRQYTHDRWSKTPAPPGGPPAMIDGHLADSFVVAPGSSFAGWGSAWLGNTAIYAGVQEFGAVITVKSRRSLMWKTDYPTDRTNFAKSEREGDGLFLNFARRVEIPARDYFIRGVEEAEDEIERRKAAVFMTRVWGE